MVPLLPLANEFQVYCKHRKPLKEAAQWAKPIKIPVGTTDFGW
jgi:hypothetical protein